jgi:hypothetical protein
MCHEKLGTKTMEFLDASMPAQAHQKPAAKQSTRSTSPHSLAPAQQRGGCRRQQHASPAAPNSSSAAPPPNTPASPQSKPPSQDQVAARERPLSLVTPSRAGHLKTSPSSSFGSGCAATCCLRAALLATLPAYLPDFCFFSSARICGQVAGQGGGRGGEAEAHVAYWLGQAHRMDHSGQEAVATAKQSAICHSACELAKAKSTQEAGQMLTSVSRLMHASRAGGCLD